MTESPGEINIGSFYFISALLFRHTKKDKSDCAPQMDCSRKSSGIVGLMKRDAYIRLLEALPNGGAGCVLRTGVSARPDVILTDTNGFPRPFSI